MKLLESIEELEGSIDAAIQRMVAEIFGEDLDDDAIEEIVNNLSLSDLLELDRAYTEQDHEAIRDIIGPLPTMEYSMGRQATSQASNRPAPGRIEKPETPAKDDAPKNTIQTNRNYNSGSQNAVTTQKVDQTDPNDPDAQMQDDKPIQETDNYSEFYSVSHVLGLLHTWNEKGKIDSNVLNQLKQMTRAMSQNGEVQADALLAKLDQKGFDSNKFKQGLDHFANKKGYKATYSIEESHNVVDMITWLKKRAGIK